MDPKLDKWNRWLGKIEGEITTLLIYRNVYLKLQKIIHENEALHQPSFFYDFIFNSFAAWAVMCFRRHIKTGNQSISLKNLLIEIKDNAELLSRKYFISLYSQPALQWADKDFDRATGESGAAHVNPAFVQEDILKLEEVAKTFEPYADKVVAHLDKTSPTELPTWDDLKDACVTLEKLILKYRFLLKATSPHILVDENFCDISILFREPWIKET